jgi:hypothetical protein
MLFTSTALWAQTTIMSQDFEGGSLPTGWSQITNATDGGWKFGVNTALQSSSFPITSHTLMACTNDDACNCDKSNDILIAPPLDLSSYTYVFMSFDNYYYNLSYNSVTENATIVVSTDGGATWTEVNDVAGNLGDWETRFVDLSAYAGQINVQIGFKYDDGGDWLYGWALDNVTVFEPVAGTDVSVAHFDIGKLDPTPTFVGYEKYITGLPLNPRIIVGNSGTEVITSFDISWSDGTNTYTQSVTGVNIPALQNYEVTVSQQYTTLAGSHNLTLEVSNVNNGATEINATNNSGSWSVEGVTPNPDMKYVAEEATGTWCGWCPRGTVFMKYMHETYPDQFVGIAVHNGDPMTITDYDDWVGGFPGFQGYPSVIINRDYIIDPSELEFDFIDKVSEAPEVKVSLDATLNLSNNELMVTANGEFLQSLSGDYRFVVILVEDSVHGTTSQWKQTNYYAANANGPMGGFESLPSSVPAADMYYDFVGRGLISDVEGTSGSLPSSISSGSTYSYNFTYDVPTTYNVNLMHVVGMVVKYSTGEVLNAGTGGLKFTTGIENTPANASMFMYPNPTSQATYIDLKLAQPASVMVETFNSIGQRVAFADYGHVSGSQLLSLNTSNLPSGMYQLKVTAGDQVITQKLIVSH